MTIFIIFIFGLIVGSFLNAVIHRLASGQSLLEKHSQCPHCQHELAWPDLWPVVSFFILRRRCRYCRKAISWQYPAVELATAVAFILIYKSSAPPPFLPLEGGGVGGGEINLLFQLVFACFLIVIFVYDLQHYLILDKVVFPALVMAVFYQFVQGQFWPGVLSAALLSGFFAILYVLSRGRWIGAGDIKLGLFLGLLAPFPQTIVLFFLAYLSGALVSVGLLLFSKKGFKDRLPFGTFLTASAYVTMIWGEGLVNWYLNLIGIK